MSRNIKVLIFVVFCFLLNSGIIYALSIDELKTQIEVKLQEKARLEEENRKLEAQIEATAKQANTLKNTVKTLDTTQKKLQNDLKVTQTKIASTELSIKKLGIEITETQKKINNNRSAIAETLRAVDGADDKTLLEALLTFERVSDFWNDVENIKRVQEIMRQNTLELMELNQELGDKKKQNVEKKVELTDFKEELTDKKTIVDQNKTAKTKLLTQTKNKEAEYRAMLARNIELGKKFEQELFEFESQLRIAIDKSLLPTERQGILLWPLDSITITQRFGKTVESKRLYVSGTHNGVDFRASVGTPVKVVLSGIIKGVGNTDSQSGCYSYGRWILVEHPNGLSSLYAHLSASRVETGQSVVTGQVIAYSGGQPGVNGSGFSTGPHLHLGLYATQGVKIDKYTQSKFCKNVSIPIAGANAYLDPLAYLPTLN